MKRLRKAFAVVLTLTMLFTLFTAFTAVDVGASGETVIPAGTTTYDFTTLTSTTLAAGTEGFEGFSGTVTTAASDSKAYVQISKSSSDALQFVVEGTWTATFSSEHSNNAKGLMITAPDGTLYGKKSSSEGLTLTDMPAGTYTISAVAATTDLNDGEGNTVSVTSNHCYLSTAVFTVESNDPPEAVTDLTATAGNGLVTLSWTGSSLASGYEIYVDGSTTAYTTTDTYYTVDDLTNDVEHTFTVVAVNSAGSSTGVTVSATPKEPTDPPGEFTLTATAGDSVVNLSWTAAQYASTYSVYNGSTLLASGLTSRTYQHSGLTNGTEYTYTVVAVNKNGETSSNTVTSTPVEPEPSQIEIIDEIGWLEMAAVKWTNPVEVDKYNVYYKGASDSDYTKIDDELVRYYGSYYRADVLGLAEGVYTIKIAAVVNGAETDAVVSNPISVSAQIREGFAFDPNSSHYDSTGIGGYNMDGTVKDGAQILYIDDTNKDTVEHTVLVNGKENVGVGLVNILALREKNNAETTPLIIRMIGQVTSPDGKNSSGYVQIKACENVTFEGVGEDATTYNWSFLLRDAVNCEVKNLAVMEFYDDGISLDTDNYNCWVHNCDIFYGQDRGGDQKKGDGSLDVKSGSDYCTFSYNHFWDSGKCSLCGMKDDSYMGYHMTYYGNWFDHSDSRMPRVRGDQVHVYNNYYDGNSKYGAGSCTGSSVYVEKNVFRNVKYAVLTSQQGSDIAGENTGTFSGEDGGVIKMYDNLIISGDQSHDVIAYDANDTPVEFDAYVATSRSETVPSTVTASQGGGTYTNFDTASTMYSYTPFETSEVVNQVETYAGRMQGGDVSYEFDDSVDDSLSDRNETLGAMLQSYTTTLVTSYTSDNEYPSTSGTTPTAKPTAGPTIDPNLPTATPAPTATPVITSSGAEWNFGEAPFTVTDSDGTVHPDTNYFPAGSASSSGVMQYNVTSTSITPEAFGGLNYKISSTSENAYQSSGKTFADGYKGTWQLKSGGAGSTSDKVFTFTPSVAGTVKVYARSGSSSKDAVLTIAQGTTSNTLTLVATSSEPSDLPVLSMDVIAGTQVKIYSDSNTGYYAIVYDADPNAPTPEPTATSEPTPVPDYDYAITSAVSSGTDVSVTVDYLLEGAAPEARLMVAAYSSENIMTEFAVYTSSVSADGTYSVPITVGDGEFYKVFLWSADGGMSPYAELYDSRN